MREPLALRQLGVQRTPDDPRLPLTVALLGRRYRPEAPAIVKETLTVVVSPLISLMKDQVDGLVASGVAAAQLNSAQSSAAQRDVERALHERTLRLLFVSPERLAMTNFRQLLGRVGVSAFAIDEAHCISQWGHDFRPEYRQLRELRQLFPNASLHAFTATATERVRLDIVAIRHRTRGE